MAKSKELEYRTVQEVKAAQKEMNAKIDTLISIYVSHDCVSFDAVSEEMGKTLKGFLYNLFCITKHGKGM